MVKKILKCTLRVVIFIILYLLQIYIVNKTTFFGVTGDLCLMAVALTALTTSNISAYITAGICGMVSDLLFLTGSLKYTVIYIIVVAILIELKKLYKQDTKMAIIIFSVAATIIREIIMLIFNVVQTGEFVNIFVYIFNILKQSIINICLGYIIYLAFKLCRQKE